MSLMVCTWRSSVSPFLGSRWFALAFLVCALFARGQSPGSSPATIQVDSRIVLLDISVTDAAGKPVTDLREDEFRITERKVPQTIASFEPPSAHDVPAAAAGKMVVNSTADLAKIGQSPITVLVLDELNMSFEDRAYARTKLLEWLGRQPAILSQPTALMAINETDFRLLRDFTQDRDALLAVLKKHTGDVVWRINSGGRTGPQASENMASTMGAVERVAQAMRGVPGRKNVIWVGNGFASVNMSDVGHTSADELEANIRHLSNVMLHARVTLSIVGPTLKASQEVDIETQSDSDMKSSGGYDGLSISEGGVKFTGVAASSGGRAYGGRNDLDAEIGQSVAAGATYYTISYRPSSASNDPKVYRQIHVEVTRPGLTVQTRDGYFEEPKDTGAPPKISTQQLAFDLNGAALSTLSYTDLHVTAEPAGAGNFTLHATARDLTWRDLPDGRRHADVVLLAACLSPTGRLLSKTFATLGSSTDASLASIGISTAALQMHVVPAPGTARIRFVVRDVLGGRIGTADLTP
jgi:VWFA-related protein